MPQETGMKIVFLSAWLCYVVPVTRLETGQSVGFRAAF
jgi:hypothetical protein